MVVKKNRKRTNFKVKCDECGALASVFTAGESRWYCHCHGCGKKWFGSDTDLLERLKHSDTVCHHNPATKPCKGGYTTWCPLCRVRTFSYAQDALQSKSSALKPQS